MWLHYVLALHILITGFLFGDSSNKYNRKMLIIITFGVLTVIVSLRASTVGNDTVSYLNLFSGISNFGLTVYAERYEIGYLYLNKILATISLNPQVIIFVTGVIVMCGFARFIYKYSELPWLSVFLFFSLGYYGSSMNTIRLNIAIVIILLSYDFILKKKIMKFALLVILASLFHRTAVIFILAWPISKLKFNKHFLFALVIINLVLFSIFPSIMEVAFNIFPTYKYYVDSIYLDGNIRLASLIDLVVGLCIITLGYFITVYNEKERIKTLLPDETNEILNREKQENNTLLLLITIGVSVTFLSIKFNLLDRISDYFMVFSLIYLPNCIKGIKNTRLKALIIYLVTVLFFMYVTLILIFRPEWNILYPYSFFFSQ